MMKGSIICSGPCTTGSQSWTITLNDVTLSYSSLKSAELIEERPAQCVIVICKLTTLADFGSASYGHVFTSVSGRGFATIRGINAPIGLLPNAEIAMVQSSKGRVIAQPSSLSADGTSFTV